MASKPPCLPRRDSRRGGGNCPISASELVRLAERKSVPFVAPAVAISAATAISVKPASPRVGRAASAIAVSPYPIASSTVSVPKTPIEISTYVAVVRPSARAIARGSSRAGSRSSATVNVITPKPRNAKNVRAMLAMIFENDG